jgi:hypothetical protein
MRLNFANIPYCRVSTLSLNLIGLFWKFRSGVSIKTKNSLEPLISGVPPLKLRKFVGSSGRLSTSHRQLQNLMARIIGSSPWFSILVNPWSSID